MDWWTGFFAGAILGGLGMLLALSLCKVAGDSDIEQELTIAKMEKEKYEAEVKLLRKKLLEIAMGGEACGKAEQKQRVSS